jgi:uncharacterized protein YheU (UPF0270 family)
VTGVVVDAVMDTVVVVPAEQLSAEALIGLIEAFITREGTDYGELEWTLTQKVEQVRERLRRREALIVFDPLTETCTLMSRQELREAGHSVA